MEEELLYIGPPVDDPEILERVAPELRRRLERRNGWIAYGGGLHVRGASRDPDWHSLRTAWEGDQALWRLFPAIAPADVPFAEDALGDQYVLRDGRVHRLAAEAGELEDLGLGLNDFLATAEADPEEFLALEPLMHYLDAGETLRPGQLLSAFPPFVAEESRTGVTLRSEPALERRANLSNIARAVGQMRDGAQLRFEAGE